MAETSKTVDQALTVLLEVGENGPITPAVAARGLGMHRTVVYRILATLHQRGFVTRQHNGYVLGPIFLRIADQVHPEMRLHAHRVMRDLSEAIGETVLLYIPDGEEVVALDQVVSEANIVRVEHGIGTRQSIVKGANGRAILAFVRPSISDRITSKAENAAHLRRQLESVRQLGYALSHDETQEGIHGLGVPVFDGAGVVVGSLTIVVPVTRAERLTQHTDALLRAAADLSAALSGQA